MKPRALWPDLPNEENLNLNSPFLTYCKQKIYIKLEPCENCSFFILAVWCSVYATFCCWKISLKKEKRRRHTLHVFWAWKPKILNGAYLVNTTIQLFRFKFSFFRNEMQRKFKIQNLKFPFFLPAIEIDNLIYCIIQRAWLYSPYCNQQGFFFLLDCKLLNQ